MTFEELKAEHDTLLAERPSGAVHDTENCKFCKAQEEPNEGGDMSGTYSEEEVNTAVAQAVKDALAPFQENANLEALAAAIDAAVAPVKAEVEELQTALDTATVRANKAESDYQAVIAWLDAEKASADAAAVAESRKAERLDAVKEFAFSTDYLDASIDRWVAMEDEAFAGLVADWKALFRKETAAAVKVVGVPAETSMKNVRTDDVGSDRMKNIRELSRLGLTGTDIRTVGKI